MVLADELGSLKIDNSSSKDDILKMITNNEGLLSSIEKLLSYSDLNSELKLAIEAAVGQFSADNASQNKVSNKGKGFVFAIVGPSSVGKSTIVNNLLEYNKELDWKVDGVDLASKRKFEELNQKYKDELEGDDNFKSLLSKIPDAIAGHIFHIIHEGEISEDRFEKYRSDEFESLVRDHCDNFKAIKEEVLGNEHLAVKFTESAHEFAVDNAKNGSAVILDLVPITEDEKAGYNMLDSLKKCASSKGFDGEIMMVSASCDIDKIVEHMNKRNSGGDITQRRFDLKPFSQYAHMHQVAVNDSEAIGQMTVSDIENAVKLYSGLDDDERQKDTVHKLCNMIGIDANSVDSDHKFLVSLKSPEQYDLHCNTDSGIGVEDAFRNSEQINQLIFKRTKSEKEQGDEKPNNKRSALNGPNQDRSDSDKGWLKEILEKGSNSNSEESQVNKLKLNNKKQKQEEGITI